MVDARGCLDRSWRALLRCPRYDRQPVGDVRNGDTILDNDQSAKEEVVMARYSLSEKRDIAWRLRSWGATAKGIHEHYGWGLSTVSSWGKDEEDWEERKRKRRTRINGRYRTDPVYHKNILAANKKWQDDHPEEHRRRSREWYRKKYNVGGRGNG